MDSYCRICCTDQNLKYTREQMQQIYNKADCKTKKEQQLCAVTAIPTRGNICHDCEEQLHNFDSLDDDVYDDLEDSSADINRPVIVDNNDLLYSLLHQRLDKKKSGTAALPSNTKKVASAGEAKSVNYELTQHSLGSDGDTEVIEVLTSSRESSPLPQSTEPNYCEPMPISVANGNERVVAFIDLENEEAKPLINKKETNAVVTADNITPQTRKNRRRKVYAERELRLIARVSLISSDSECEEDLRSPPVVAPPVTAVAATPALNNSEDCEARLEKPVSCVPDHAGIYCPVCTKDDFDTPQQLIHHIRSRHLSHEQLEELLERPRRARDSAMTIRLLYLKRYTYYECQLCGRIDALLKAHNQHIMKEHAIESRSLKDPMMKLLKCPICNLKCGSQYLTLCVHLLMTHTRQEYKSYLREVRKLRASQKHAHSTAKIYQYAKRKTYFLECRLCGKLVAGFVNHAQHLAAHKKQSKLQGAAQRSASNTKTTTPQEQHRTRKTGRKSKIASAKISPPKAVKPKGLHTGSQGQRCSKAKRSMGRVSRAKPKGRAPVRQTAPFTYDCQQCSTKFVGLINFNKHRLREHNEIKERDSSRFRRRKPLLALDAWQHRCSQTAQDSEETSSTLKNHENEESPVWLDDLMKMHQSRNTTASRCPRAIQVCIYCAHLFANTTDLEAHISLHLEQKHIPIVRFTPRP